MKFSKSLWMFLTLALMLSIVSSRVQAAPFDQQFIDSMVPHHQSALMMAQMAVKQAHSPEVRQLARKMIKDQQKEIAQLKAWRKAWYGSAEVPMMHSHMMGDKMMMPGEMMGLPMKGEMDMGKLRRARGRAFDRMFLQMMIPHHAGAIMMADEALKVTGRKQLRQLAAKIIDAQSSEIGQMHAMHDRRFGHIRG